MADRYIAIHQNANGPGNSRPTAVQIIQDEQFANEWENKVVLMTRCSSGIGVETAKALHVTGAMPYLNARNLSKAEQALSDLTESDRVHLLELDLNSLESVRTCAKEFLSKSQQLNVLICNAGVMATPFGRTKDGFET